MKKTTKELIKKEENIKRAKEGEKEKKEPLKPTENNMKNKNKYPMGNMLYFISHHHPIKYDLSALDRLHKTFKKNDKFIIFCKQYDVEDVYTAMLYDIKKKRVFDKFIVPIRGEVIEKFNKDYYFYDPTDDKTVPEFIKKKALGIIKTMHECQKDDLELLPMELPSIPPVKLYQCKVCGKKDPDYGK